MLICTLAGLALCAFGNTPGNPYQGIVDRNVFGLKSPPPPPDPEANKPPPPKIFLTGITTILGNKRALLKMTPPATPGVPAKEQSFTLREGERDGELEVLEIDEKAGTVKVNEYGSITTLSFENNGVKAPAAPVPVAVPNAAGFVPAPAANPFTPAGRANTLPRPMRPTPAGAATSPTSGIATPAYAGGASAYGSGVSLPAFGTAAPAFSQPQENAAPTLDRVDQAIFLAAQKQHFENTGDPIAVLIPPVPPDLAPPEPAANNPPTTTPKPWMPPRAPSLPPLPQ
jgi:hypothetical protein